MTIIATVMVVNACENKRNVGDLTFDKVDADRIVYLLGDTTKPSCHIDISYSYIASSDDKVMQDSLNRLFAANAFDENYAHETPEDIVAHYIDAYIQDYQKNVSSMYEEDQKASAEGNDTPPEAWYNYEYLMQANVHYYKRDLLVYQVYVDSYSGGAHGMTQNRFFNYDLNTMRQLTLDDIFMDNSDKGLVELLWAQLMQDKSVTSREELENMGYGVGGDLIPSENFFLEKDGITFVYNPYEFAPYSTGIVYIKLPITTVRLLLRQNEIIAHLWK
jgi:hypothetical protein